MPAVSCSGHILFCTFPTDGTGCSGSEEPRSIAPTTLSKAKGCPTQQWTGPSQAGLRPHTRSAHFCVGDVSTLLLRALAVAIACGLALGVALPAKQRSGDLLAASEWPVGQAVIVASRAASDFGRFAVTVEYVANIHGQSIRRTAVAAEGRTRLTEGRRRHDAPSARFREAAITFRRDASVPIHYNLSASPTSLLAAEAQLAAMHAARFRFWSVVSVVLAVAGLVGRPRIAWQAPPPRAGVPLRLLLMQLVGLLGVALALSLQFMPMHATAEDALAVLLLVALVGGMIAYRLLVRTTTEEAGVRDV